MPIKTIVLERQIVDLTPELFGYTSIRFVDWEPDEFLTFSTGTDKMRDIRRGEELAVAGDFLLYKETKAFVSLAIELN